MSVTEQEFRTYIETLHRSLEATATKYLKANLRKRLLHLSLLPARIIGYVSTQFGVAIEYEPAENTHLEMRRGSARIEDLLVQAPRRLRNIGPFLYITGPGAGVFGIIFSGAFPFRLGGENASESFSEVTFEAGPWKRVIHYAEVFGDHSSENWTREMAISRAKDEVLAALVEANRAAEKHVSVPEYIEHYKRKTVLVLGDYDQQGLSRLKTISQVLSQLGYHPLLMKDVPDHPHCDLTQKVVLMGSISRFVVVDDSSKSGHIFEVQLCKQNNWVTILLRAGGRGGSWMTAGASYFSKVILEKPYDPAVPKDDLLEAVAWAEDKLRDLQIKFDNTYPWRKTSI